jgi:hypothetical protein
MNPIPANRTCGGALTTMYVGASGRDAIRFAHEIFIGLPARAGAAGAIVTETLSATARALASDDSQSAHAGADA